MSLFDAFFPAAFAHVGSARAASGGAGDPDGPGRASSVPLARSSLPGAPDATGAPSQGRAGGCGCGCGHAATAEAESAAGSEGAVAERLRSKTLNAWTMERPGALGVFHELGLDACCGGERTLVDACRAHGLDVALVLGRLEALPTHS